jgi:hypothetical protein
MKIETQMGLQSVKMGAGTRHGSGGRTCGDSLQQLIRFAFVLNHRHPCLFTIKALKQKMEEN